MEVMLPRNGSKQVACLPSALFARDLIYFLLDPCAKETIRDIKQSCNNDMCVCYDKEF